MTPKDTVTAATTKLFVEQDPAAVDDYFGPEYIQHSALAADGIDGLKALAGNLPDDFGYRPARVVADGDLVVVHGVYTGFGPDPLVAFDVFRVKDGRVVEHWDSLTPWVADTASGRSQVDGPIQPAELDKTQANKALVAEFAERVLIGADYGLLTDYISTDTYLQHNPEAADGLEGFGAAVGVWASTGKSLAYKKIHQLIGEGDFVFTRAEGEFGGPVVYNDLWRIEDGRIVEHWDVIASIPADIPHDNGVF